MSLNVYSINLGGGGGGGGGTWGSITGTLSNQLDLQAALDGKISVLGASTDRALVSWNGTDGDALHSNATTIDSSGDLFGNRDISIYGGASSQTRIKITDSVVGFHFNTGSPLVSIDGGGLTTFYPDSQIIFGTGSGTGGNWYLYGAATNAFNTAINGNIRGGTNPTLGGDILVEGGQSAGDDGGVYLGLPSRAVGDEGGFVHIPTIGGTPTSAPNTTDGTMRTGYVAGLAYDVSASKLFLYDGSAWKSVTFT